MFADFKIGQWTEIVHKIVAIYCPVAEFKSRIVVTVRKGYSNIGKRCNLCIRWMCNHESWYALEKGSR